MRIALIRPSFSGRIAGINLPSNRIQPLALANIAGLTDGRHELIFFDDRLESIDYGSNPDLVAISVETHTARRSYEISERFMSRKIPVVMGGFHPTLIPEEVLEHADSVVIGEAEGVWAQILQDTERRSLKRYYKAETRSDLTGIRPDRSIFKNKRYMPLIPVEFGRGCRNSCDYCSVGAFYGGRYIHRPVEEVVSEIKNLDKGSIILFTDDNLMADPVAAKRLFAAITPVGIRWAGQANMGFVRDKDLLRLASKSGCMCLMIGFESLLRDNLVKMNKRSNIIAGDYEEIVGKIKDTGIKIYASFVFGYDADTKESFEKVLKFALKSKFFIANFNHLAPYPGTPLYKRLLDESRLIYKKWWLEGTYRYGSLTFRPISASVEEIEKGCKSLKAEFNSLPNVLYRAWDFKSNAKDLRNIYEYLVCNMFSSKEIVVKHNMKMGGEGTK